MTLSLRKYRESLGISLQVAADQIGTKKGTLSRIETHKADPSADMIRKIVAWSNGNVSADSLLGITSSAQD